MSDIKKEKRFQFCVKKAMVLGEILMQEDISHLESKNWGNNNYILMTISLITAGVIATVSKITGMSTSKILEDFNHDVNEFIDQRKKKLM